MISFSFVPSDIRVPGSYVEFDASKAVSSLPPAPQKILLVAQRLATGTTPALTPVRLTSKAAAVAALGRGSLGALAAAALFDSNDRTEAWAIGLDDAAAGGAAAGTITVTGPATANGTIDLMIAGTRVSVGVVAGAAATAIAASIITAVNASPDLPVSASSNPGVVILSARNKGTAGNDIDVRHSYFQGQSLPAGVGLAIAPMTGGSTDPDVAPIWPVLGDTAFPTIVLPFAAAATLSGVETELASRAGPTRAIEGMAYAAVRGTVGSLAALGTARNSMFVSIIGANGSPTHPVAWAASYAGQIAFAGANDPARPFRTLPLATVLPPALAQRFMASERDLLLHSGISTWTVDNDGVVRIERAITCYQTGPQGFPDVAWLDVNTPLTLFYLRFAVRSRMAQRFPRHKLASDGANVPAGQAIVTPRVIRAELIALFRDLETAGLVENLDQFIADLVVERDSADRTRVNALIPPDIVNQFNVLGARIEFRL